MAGWIYWGGYVASFVLVFILSVISCRRRAVKGYDSQSVIDLYAQHIVIAVFASFLSWAMFVFLLGFVVIFAGVKEE